MIAQEISGMGEHNSPAYADGRAWGSIPDAHDWQARVEALETQLNVIMSHLATLYEYARQFDVDDDPVMVEIAALLGRVNDRG
jgi:hypothetical protein